MFNLKHFHRDWVGALCLFIASLTTALADPGPLAQAPILTSAASAPNILIVVDDSGSMGWRRSGQPKRPMQQAQDAAISLLDSLSNVHVGVGSFSRYNFGGELDQPVVDLDTNRALIYKAIRITSQGTVIYFRRVALFHLENFSMATLQRLREVRTQRK